jgi:putative transcriptional regulator
MLYNILTYTGIMLSFALRARMVELCINKLLEERGLTPYWLAKRTGIDYPIMWKLLHGKLKAFRFDYIDRICAALECQPSDLIIWKPDHAKVRRESKK